MGKENPVFFDDEIYRFVVLHHTETPPGGRGDHWDWMFDWPAERFPASFWPAPAVSTEGAGLLTFASGHPPSIWESGNRFDALPLHRRVYLDYEGPISGGRGTVRRVAEGRLRWLRLESQCLSWWVESIDFLHQPSPDWAGASYCLHAAGGALEFQEPFDAAPEGRAQQSARSSAGNARATTATSDGVVWILHRLSDGVLGHGPADRTRRREGTS